MQTEANRTGEFLASEANGTRSREIVIIASGNSVKAGAVLGKIAASGKYVAVAPGASDGSEDAVAVAYDDCDASAADQSVTAIVRDAEVKTAALVWEAGVDAGEQTVAIAQLAALRIIAR